MRFGCNACGRYCARCFSATSVAERCCRDRDAKIIFVTPGDPLIQGQPYPGMFQVDSFAGDSRNEFLRDHGPDDYFRAALSYARATEKYGAATVGRVVARVKVHESVVGDPLSEVHPVAFLLGHFLWSGGEALAVGRGQQVPHKESTIH